MLLRRDAEVDQRETDPNGGKWILGRSALEMAARRLNDEISEELTHRFLKGGAEPEPPTVYEGYSGLHYACSNAHMELVQLILDYEMDQNRNIIKFIINHIVHPPYMLTLEVSNLGLRTSN